MKLALIAVLALAVVAAQQTPVFRSGTDAVLVDVSVRSRGKPVPGLTSDDFELKDNGIVQSIDSLSLETVPLDLTLLLDTSGSTDGSLIERLKRGVLDTAKLLRRDDRLRVLAVHHVVNEIIPLQSATERLAVDRLQARGGTALYDGLAAALMRPSASGRRQLIVAYTDGDDASSITPAIRVMDIALRADGVLHVVLPTEGAAAAAAPSASRPVNVRGSLMVDRLPTRGAYTANDPRNNMLDLEAITDRTGGRVFTIGLTDSVSQAFREVLEDYRTSYLLRYMPQGVVREGWHEITVRVKRSGSFDVRARKGWGG